MSIAGEFKVVAWSDYFPRKSDSFTRVYTESVPIGVRKQNVLGCVKFQAFPPNDEKIMTVC